MLRQVLIKILSHQVKKVRWHLLTLHVSSIWLIGHMGKFVCLMAWQARGHSCVQNRVFLWILSTTNTSLNKQWLTWSMGIARTLILKRCAVGSYPLVLCCCASFSLFVLMFGYVHCDLRLLSTDFVEKYQIPVMVCLGWCWPFGVHAFSPLQTMELFVLFIGSENFLGSGNVMCFLHTPFILFVMNLQWISAFGQWICDEFVCAELPPVTLSCLGNFLVNLQQICTFAWWICCEFTHLGSLCWVISFDVYAGSFVCVCSLPSPVNLGCVRKLWWTADCLSKLPNKDLLSIK